MLNLCDWNHALQYAEAACAKAKQFYGIDIGRMVYTMYDGSNGIRFFVKDWDGSVWAVQHTGITGTHENLDSLKAAIDVSIRRLINECV